MRWYQSALLGFMVVISILSIPLLASAKDRAMVVGISNYSQWGDNEIYGCVNDALWLQGLIDKGDATFKGFVPEKPLLAHVGKEPPKVLTDKDQFLEAVEGLFKDIKENERRVFFFSGHGWHPKGSKRYGLALAADGVIVPAGEFYAKLPKKLPKGSTVVICLDCCFAGGNIPPEQSKGRTQAIKPLPKFQPATGSFEFRPEEDEIEASLAEAGFAPLSTRSDRSQIRLLLACDSEELAEDAEFDKVRRGVFSRAMEQRWKNKAHDNTYEAFITSVTTIIKSWDSKQKPLADVTMPVFY